MMTVSNFALTENKNLKTFALEIADIAWLLTVP